MQITDHTSLLNYLAKTFNLQSYCEIGINKPEKNFDKIICKEKTGVDPALSVQYTTKPYRLFAMDSDKFFDWQLKKDVVEKYDLIFIDGLHHAEQVKRDLENSLTCLSENGFIVIHDTCPTEEQFTHVPRDSKVWFGNVYQFASNLCCYDGIGYSTLNIDCGCTVVWKTSKEVTLTERFEEVSFDLFMREKEAWLQIESVSEFLQYFNECKFT